MTPELRRITNFFASKRLQDGPERQTTQAGQIMDDARMAAYAAALEKHRGDEEALAKAMKDPDSIQQAYDNLIKAYRS